MQGMHNEGTKGGGVFHKSRVEGHSLIAWLERRDYWVGFLLEEKSLVGPLLLLL